MHRIFRLRKRSLLVCSMLLYCACANAQQEFLCTQINQPATAAFDFTDSLARWGNTNVYNIDDAPHRVRSITINTLPIFDESNPAENRLLYRWANAIHYVTEPHIIAEQVLFTANMPVNSSLLAESERILRERKYVGDAKIRVLQDCDNTVDLEVVTREVWTLSPDITYKAAGGHSTTGIGVSDSNILGSGQSLAFKVKKDQERNSALLAFKNPNIRGSRIEINAEYAKNSDGHHYYLQTGLPFFALENKRAWNFNYESTSEVLTQYQFGEQVSQLQHNTRNTDIQYGFSTGRQGASIKRFSFGLHVEEHQYQNIFALPAPTALGLNLDLRYPFTQFEAIEDSYVEGYNIGQIKRTEDLHIGHHLRVIVGFAPGSDNSLIVKGEYTDTLLYRPKLLLQVATNWDGRRDQHSGSWQDTVMHLELNLNRGQTDRRSLFLSLSANHSINLNNGRQVDLGGSSGLRGFDNHFLNGNTALKFTAEERVFTDYHFLQLVRLGFAVFYDAGRVFGNSNPLMQNIYQNIGVGLRLAPSRSESGQIVHLDLAYPINDKIPGGSGIQFIAEVKKSF